MNKKLSFSQVAKGLKKTKAQNEQIYLACRQAQTLAKQAIFLAQGQKIKEATVATAESEKILQNLSKKINANYLTTNNQYASALEEHLEAHFFLNLITNKKLDLPNLPTLAENIVGGLADLIGELVRQATLQVAGGETKNLKNYLKVSQEIVEFLLGRYLSGQSRQKSDEAQRHLKRLETILYEVSLRS